MDLNARICRSPIVAFFLIAYIGTWLPISPMVLGQDGVGLLPYHVPKWLFTVLFMVSPYAGPSLAGYLVMRALGGTAGVKGWLARYLKWRVGLRWYLLAILGYPILYLGFASFWVGAAPWQALLHQWPAALGTYVVGILVFPAFITWGEEPGWRGAALPLLQQRMSPLQAGVVLGTLHGLWHLPIFLIPSFTGRPFSWGAFAFNTLVGAVMTVSWSWIYNRAAGSILIAVLVHASNNGAGSLMHRLLPDFAHSEQATVLSLAAVTLVIVLMTRGRLGFDPAANRALIPVQAETP